MFYTSQPQNERDKYKEYLQLIGSLSNLFSSSTTPYLYYRIAEKMFCKAFHASDLSRGDVSYDAQKGHLGIGLKTFLQSNNNTIQKIAEFNKDSHVYNQLSNIDKIKKIAALRNARLDFTNSLYDIDNAIYHCVIRNQGKFYLYEENAVPINIENIRQTKVTKSSIFFNDGKHEYSFSLSKSTLMKRFITENFVDEFSVEIINDPLEALYSLINNTGVMTSSAIVDTIYLPLYGNNRTVHPRSGLNQWKANGRERHPNEVYIPIPSKIHTLKPNFFPKKDMVFQMKLPNGKILDTKVCQQNSKALMSNPNKELGKWILRDILKLSEYQVVDNSTLELYGIDSVRIDKMNDLEFEINFAKTDSYEEFILKLEQA